MTLNGGGKAIERPEAPENRESTDINTLDPLWPPFSLTTDHPARVWTKQEFEFIADAKDIGCLKSFDASVWAAEFCALVKAGTIDPADEGLMIGWFANALMRGWDEHAWRHPEWTCGTK